MGDNKPLFRLIIAGSRSFSNYTQLRDVCDNLLTNKRETHDIIILSGTAKGTDTLGEKYAIERGYELRRFPAEWARYAQSAGPIRNTQMAQNADGLVAFWDGVSKGTKDMIEKANKKGLLVRIIMI